MENFIFYAVIVVPMSLKVRKNIQKEKLYKSQRFCVENIDKNPFRKSF